MPISFLAAGPRQLLRCVAASMALCAFATQATPGGATPAWEFTLRTDRHSDPLALGQWGDARVRDVEPRAGRNLAYVDDEVRLSRRRDAWTWSLLARNRAMLVAGHDALAFAAQADRPVDAAVAGRWAVDARFRSFTGAGAQVARRFDLGGWQAELGTQALLLRHWRERRLAGVASFDATSGGYAADLRSVRLDDRLSFPFQSRFAASGAALMFNAELRREDRQWRLALSARDLGWLHWRGVPLQDARLATSITEIDADGFIIYRPLVEGRYSQQGATRRAPATLAAQAEWRAAAEGWLQVGLDVVSGFGALPRLGWQQRVGELEAGATWRWHEQRLTLRAHWQGWALSWGRDRPGSGAHSQELSLAYSGSL